MLLLIENLLQTISSRGIVKISFEHHDHDYRKHEENNKQELIWFKELSGYYYPELVELNHNQHVSIKQFAYGRFGWYVEYAVNGKIKQTNLDTLK